MTAHPPLWWPNIRTDERTEVILRTKKKSVICQMFSKTGIKSSHFRLVPGYLAANSNLQVIQIQGHEYEYSDRQVWFADTQNSPSYKVKVVHSKVKVTNQQINISRNTSNRVLHAIKKKHRKNSITVKDSTLDSYNL